MKYCTKCGAEDNDLARFCTGCGTEMEFVQPSSASRTLVPHEDATELDITFHCPGCEQSLAAPREMAGTQVECPTCHQPLSIPSPQPPAPLPAPVASTSGGRSRPKILLVAAAAVVLMLALAGVVFVLSGVFKDLRIKVDGKWIAVDGKGELFVYNEQQSTICKVQPNGVVASPVPLPLLSNKTDRSINYTVGFGGVAVDASGRVYVLEQDKAVIRRIDPDGKISVVAGQAGVHGYKDGIGAEALFLAPMGLAIDVKGNLYVADGSLTIRKVTPEGVVTTLAGRAAGVQANVRLDNVVYGVRNAKRMSSHVEGYYAPTGQQVDGAGGAAQFGMPCGIAVDASGSLFVADVAPAGSVRKITPDGVVTTLAGGAQNGFLDGMGKAAQFGEIRGIAADGAGYVYVADATCNLIRRISPKGMVTSLVWSSGKARSGDVYNRWDRFGTPFGLALDGHGNLWCTDSQAIRRIKLGTKSTSGAEADRNLSEAKPIEMPLQTDYVFKNYGVFLGIVEYSGPGGDVSIPKTYNGLKVCVIEDNAFRNCSNVTSISITKNVTHIESDAFEGCASRSLSVEPGNPAYCSAEGVLLDGGRTTLIRCPEGKMGSVTIPEGVTRIEDHAFLNCAGVTAVAIPDSVTDIQGSAFGRCASLTEIAIPQGVTDIGAAAFRDCTSLTSAAIPAGVTRIEPNTFSNCLKLASVTIPESVTEIGDSAFSHCVSLATITIPKGVTELGAVAFSGCTSLTSAVIPEGVTRIEPNTFSNCLKLARVTIPESVTEIGDSAFSQCASLASVSLPQGITRIEAGVFQNCTSLTALVLPGTVTVIDAGAFQGCTSLTRISIPQDLMEIGPRAFQGCTSLTTINIPDNIIAIEEGAFNGCTRLTRVSLPGLINTLHPAAFDPRTRLVRR